MSEPKSKPKVEEKVRVWEEKIAKRVIENIADIIKDKPKEEAERIASVVCLAIAAGYEVQSSWLDSIISQGWDIDEIRVFHVEAKMGYIRVSVLAPNDKYAEVRIHPKKCKEQLTKVEFEKFKREYERMAMIAYVEEMRRELERKENRIKRMERYIEELEEKLKNEKSISRNMEEDIKICREFLTEALRLISEKGLKEEYINRLHKEEIEDEIENFIDDYDC